MKLAHAITIDAPASVVLRHLVEPELLKTWTRSMRDFHHISGRDDVRSVGSQFGDSTGGQDWIVTVKDYVADKRYCAHFESRQYSYEEDFTLTEQDGKTHLRSAISITFNTVFWKLWGRLLPFTIRMDHRSNLQKLRIAVERYDRPNKSE